MDITTQNQTKYYIIFVDDEPLSYGELNIGEVLTTSQTVETFTEYSLYTSRLREFGIHLNLLDT